MNINIYGLHHLNLKELSTVYQLKCQIKHLHHNNRPPAANPHIQFTHFKSRRSNKQIYNNNQTENSTQQQQTKRKNASLRQSITTSNFLTLKIPIKFHPLPTPSQHKTKIITPISSTKNNKKLKEQRNNKTILK